MTSAREALTSILLVSDIVLLNDNGLARMVSGISNTDPASIRCELLKLQFNGPPFRPHLSLQLLISKRDPERHEFSSNPYRQPR
jgi:hypothetical protein